jgi:rubrerythrin
MAYYAQSSDLVRLAMNIEDAGWQYYRKLASASEDEKTIQLFTYLADQEIQHKIIFETIAREAESEQEHEYVIDVIREMQTGIHDLTTFVFPEHIEPGTHIDMEIALDNAIHAEEESIRVYGEMKRVFIDRFSTVLTKVIAEEQRHREILLDYLKTLPPVS